MSLNLFIDTNILLSFYHLTSDDLEELKKLIVLLKKKEVDLYLPDQVVHEFRRNREAKIADALLGLRKQTLYLQFPQLCKDYDEYSKLRKLQKQYEKEHKNLLDRIDQDLATESLKADEIIAELFSRAQNIECTEAVFQHAKRRAEKGDPPGKPGSLGDALIWESLLAAVPKREQLHFVTDDRDYVSALNETHFSHFLLQEWRKERKADLEFYARLSHFFKEHFPEIQLASEVERDLMIRKLGSSPSFAETHDMIAKMARFASEFSPSQRNRIVSSAVSNNQVAWILGDPDVRSFIDGVVQGHEKDIETENLTRLRDLLKEEDETSEEKEEEEETSNDLPF
jgi:predicted nucleic acid-binding protein